ncbi:hypothetical protein B566_EDAN017972 [Ephemera danica]|nr:hypothetical protein B566_EDAN017972 [Ephemera danica]
MELFDPIVEEFTAARTNEARMQIASKFYAPNTYDRGMEQNFQDVKDVTNFKSKQKSEQHRTRGNTAYQSGQKKVALNLYTESIANAPSDSVELSLAYANRSAVLRAMGKCRECLVDIERALSRGYPKDKSFKLLLREMLCHRDLGHGDEIVASFNKAFNLLQSLAGPRTELWTQLRGSGCLQRCKD